MNLDDIKKQYQDDELFSRYKTGCKQINKKLMDQMYIEFQQFFLKPKETDFKVNKVESGVNVYYKGRGVYKLTNNQVQNEPTINVSLALVNENNNKSTIIFTTSETEYLGKVEQKNVSGTISIKNQQETTEESNKKYYTAVANGTITIKNYYHVGKNVYNSFTELLEKETF